MASGQVLPNSSRKQGHLEAGKKKLEEFRKLRKEKAGKKAGFTVQNASESSQNNNTILNGPTTLNENIESTDSTSTKIKEETPFNPTQSNEVSSNGWTHDSSQKEAKNEGSNLYGNLANGYHENWREKNDFIDSVEKKPPLFSSSASQDFGNLLEESRNNFRPETSGSDAPLTHITTFGDSTPSQSGFGGTSDFTFSKGEEKLVNNFTTGRAASNPSYTDLDASFKSYSSQIQLQSPVYNYGASTARSRPSFLDTIGVNRVSNTPEPDRANPLLSLNNSNLQTSHEPFDLKGQDSINREKESYVKSSLFGTEQDLYRDLSVRAKDEDFAALEQLIEDLTQEKFSLQRALDTSKTIAESLASDNASLTEDYNQQGQVISQLRSDMERLQEEIKAQLLALETVRMEYTNAQLECNAADERAKILASEVISLEEKALRLRSNELKLEKQVESLHSEISSYKRKVSILEKERQDFQSTIDALQEEQKLLQTKVRNASVNEKLNDLSKSPESRTDASTSTEDLDASERSVPQTALNADITTTTESTVMQESVPPLISFPLAESSVSVDIPEDQIRMIDNIYSLISELSVEREELMRALRIESSNCSKLKDLNKELTQKLEAQTQRLELLTSQRLANENLLLRPVESHFVNDSTVYADEGDEVVERVLGWIMKLFPGGPAKRRTSKLL